MLNLIIRILSVKWSRKILISLKSVMICNWDYDCKCYNYGIFKKIRNELLHVLLLYHVNR